MNIEALLFGSTNLFSDLLFISVLYELILATHTIITFFIIFFFYSPLYSSNTVFPARLNDFRSQRAR